MKPAKNLLPDEIAKGIPPLYSQENVPDPLVQARLFHALSSWQWFVVEMDPIERICFGLVHGFEEELGYFSLDELEGVSVLGLGVERDKDWTQRSLSQCWKKERGT